MMYVLATVYSNSYSFAFNAEDAAVSADVQKREKSPFALNL
jgi:hypothetical protein